MPRVMRSDNFCCWRASFSPSDDRFDQPAIEEWYRCRLRTFTGPPPLIAAIPFAVAIAPAVVVM